MTYVFFGFLILFGAFSAIDTSPESEQYVYYIYVIIGFIFMIYGVKVSQYSNGNFL